MCPPPLGDGFPHEYKLQFVKDNLKIGAVIKFYCDRAHKEKRFLVVGEKYDKLHFGLVYLNTEINTYFNPTPELEAMHLPLEFTPERIYLSHDCFVACNDVFQYPKDFLESLMYDSTKVYLGDMSTEDLNKVIARIKTSKTIRPAFRKEFGLFY